MDIINVFLTCKYIGMLYLFQLEYGKKYKSKSEDNLRMNIFLQNKEEIAKHNAEYELGMHTYTVGINQFSDMVSNDFVLL